MGDMSRAIRLELQKGGLTMAEIPTGTLTDYELIVGAFLLDLRAELSRRGARPSVEESGRSGERC